MSITDLRVLRTVPVVFAKMGMMLTPVQQPIRRERLKQVLRIRSQRDMLLLPAEACQILSAVKAVEHLPGDMAEVGAGKGASAKLIASAAPNRMLHVFDTFEGLPAPTRDDSSRFKAGQYKSSFEEVQNYLRGCNVKLYKGLFPATAPSLSPLSFAFVHLDGDLYETMKAGLEWFYQRMVRGAILIAHDFASSKGVERAFAEFFADKPEPYVELTGSQGMFVKF